MVQAVLFVRESEAQGELVHLYPSREYSLVELQEIKAQC